MTTLSIDSSEPEEVLSALDEIGNKFAGLGMTHDESALAISAFVINHYDNRHGYGVHRRIPVPARLSENVDEISKIVKPYDIEFGIYKDGWNVVDNTNGWVDLMNKFRDDGTITRP